MPDNRSVSLDEFGYDLQPEYTDAPGDDAEGVGLGEQDHYNMNNDSLKLSLLEKAVDDAFALPGSYGTLAVARLAWEEYKAALAASGTLDDLPDDAECRAIRGKAAAGTPPLEDRGAVFHQAAAPTGKPLPGGGSNEPGTSPCFICAEYGQVRPFGTVASSGLPALVCCGCIMQIQKLGPTS